MSPTEIITQRQLIIKCLSQGYMNATVVEQRLQLTEKWDAFLKRAFSLFEKSFPRVVLLEVRMATTHANTTQGSAQDQLRGGRRSKGP
jgi:hypothetical protein